MSEKISKSKSFRTVCGRTKKPGFFPGQSVSPVGKSRVSPPSAVAAMRQPEKFLIY
ncbi:Uncharacterized protein dnm_037040 [Desulfonema magnum]|uniref:Uncharacterized protein n=1 Tax=Desulfonema magnum TaxID=45655 RepID=A0A975BMD1_9BACT|nr:Uncharacterized protein dnm_037040 [Desulfonema magnum]